MWSLDVFTKLIQKGALSIQAAGTVLAVAILLILKGVQGHEDLPLAIPL